MANKRRTHKRHVNMGSVSHGTMRAEDLIPTFLAELQAQRPCRRAHRKLAREIEARIERDGTSFDENGKALDEAYAYYDSDDAQFDLEALFDALGEYCADYFYFGARSGDGADYGYWLSEYCAQDIDGNGGLVVDLAKTEIPGDARGEVLAVNDHGNCTLYRIGNNGHKYEVWSVV